MKRLFSFLFCLVALQSPAFAKASAQNQNIEPDEDVASDVVSEELPDTSAADVTKTMVPWMNELKELHAYTKNKNKNYVFWIISPPKKPLDLRSADYFRRFVNANHAVDLSHNLVAWTCKNSAGQKVEGAVAITGESNSQSMTMFRRGFGLTTFFTTFTDGEIQGTDDVAYELSLRKNRGIATMGFEVTTGECENMVGFLHKFMTHPNRPSTKFGITPDPAKFEGGGCVTLAMTLLQKAGQMESVIPKFHRVLRAPVKYFGGNLEAPDATDVPEVSWLQGKPKSIPAGELLGNIWAQSGATAKLRLLDPELMLYSIKTVKEEYLAGLSDADRKTDEVLLNKPSLATRSMISESEAGANDGAQRRMPGFVSFTINDDFDKQTAQVSAETRRWLKGELAAGKSLTAGTYLGSPIFVLER